MEDTMQHVRLKWKYYQQVRTLETRQAMPIDVQIPRNDAECATLANISCH